MSLFLDYEMLSFEKNDSKLSHNENIASKTLKNTQHRLEKSANTNSAANTTSKITEGKVNNGFLTDSSSTSNNEHFDVIYALPKKSNRHSNQTHSATPPPPNKNQLNKNVNSRILAPSSILIEEIDFPKNANKKSTVPFPLSKKIKTKKMFLSHYSLLYMPFIFCILLIFLGIVAGATYLIIRSQTDDVAIDGNVTSFFKWWTTTKMTVLYSNTTLNLPNKTFANNHFAFTKTPQILYVNSSRTPTTNKYANVDLNISTSMLTTQTHVNIEQTCGFSKNKPRAKQYRIMKGSQAMPRAWPWVVSIGFFGPKASLAHACGGALINRRFLITASHCVIEYILIYLIIKLKIIEE